MKRIVSLLLVLFLLPGIFAACSNETANENTSDTTAAADNTADSAAETEEIYVWYSAIKQEDFGKDTFNILNGCTASWYNRNEVTSAELSGEPINDAIYERNSRVEEYLNIEIVETSTSDVVSDTKVSIQAGADDYDISLITLMSVYPLALQNMFYEYGDIPNIDLTAKWWDQNAVADMSVGGKHWFCISDFDTTRFDGIRSLYFNKELIEMYSLDNPYNLVDDNKWTLEKFMEMCASVVTDLDGDSTFTDADRYGIVSYDEIMFDLITYGCGFKYIDKDENDMLQIAINDEKYYDVYEQIRRLLHDDDLAFDARHESSKYLRGLGDRIQEQLFLENGALFYSECMAWTRVLREMEADFGVLPPPKYDESQDRYYSVIINPFVTTVPITASNVAETGLIIEALAAASHDTVVPAYVDITLTGKVARDPDTVRMLNLVFDELAYNIHLSNITIRSTILSTVQANSTALASALEKSSKAITKGINNTNESFAELIAGE